MVGVGHRQVPSAIRRSRRTPGAASSRVSMDLDGSECEAASSMGGNGTCSIEGHGAKAVETRPPPPGRQGRRFAQEIRSSARAHAGPWRGQCFEGHSDSAKMTRCLTPTCMRRSQSLPPSAVFRVASDRRVLTSKASLLPPTEHACFRRLSPMVLGSSTRAVDNDCHFGDTPRRRLGERWLAHRLATTNRFLALDSDRCSAHIVCSPCVDPHR